MRTLRSPLARTICLVLVIALPVSAVAQSGDDPASEPAATTMDSPGDMTVVEDLVYASRSQADDRTELKLDLYVGAGGEDALMVVYVAGGD